MKTYNQRLFFHLDDLRNDYGLSIKDFCEGVCDRRQYSRYQNARHIISHKNVIKFYEKLGYEVFGELDDYKNGHKRFYLKKCLKRT